VLGIDLAPEALAVARLHALEAGIPVEYRAIAVEALADSEASGYDLVTCLEMLEHVPDPSAILAALGRLVRPGGNVICSTINRNPKAFALAIVGAEYVMRLLPRGTHQYARLIRPSELSRWARAAGLELVELAGLEYDPFSRTARVSGDVSVNYLAHFRRPEPAGAA
jgi:2-polyprenyl-6-hydroxyphenyl methylase/3-demethylubiquinone-9 3-methyltransferase